MTTLYAAMGGELGIQRIVTRFYELMDSEPRFSALRAVHGADLTSARQKLFEYLSGWTGGPSLYTDKYGHPRLRQRHMPFRITSQHAEQWLSAMDIALKEAPLEAEVYDFIYPKLERLAFHMVNTDDVIH